MNRILLNSLNSSRAQTVNGAMKLKEYFPSEDIQDFFLRAEDNLNNGKSSHEIQLVNTAGKTAAATERLLTSNDAFMPLEVGLFIKKATIAGGREFPGNDRLYTFPLASLFNGAAVGGFTEAQCVEAVYNGDLGLYSDGKELMYKIDTSIFRHEYATADSSPNILDVFYPLAKQFVLFGGNDNVAKIDFKSSNVGSIQGDTVTAGALDTEQNKLVLIFKGLIIRGGADRVNHIDLQGLMGGSPAML